MFATSESSQDGQSLREQFEALNVTANIDQTKNPGRYNRARTRFISTQWNKYFGEESKLANWQKLCSDLGLEGQLTSITKCRKALRRVWVNIWDFLDAVRAGTQVYLWPSQRKLAEYTTNTQKFFPKKAAKEGGPVKELLAHIF